MSQEQVNRSKSEVEETVATEAKDLHNSDLAADVEDILDEIDGVLEENAEEFVKGFVQKGGQ